VPLVEQGLDSSSGLGFVRDRLALLGKTLFLVSFGFYLFLLASLVLIGGAPFVAVVRGPVALGHLCASLTMAPLWLLAGRARPSWSGVVCLAGAWVMQRAQMEAAVRRAAIQPAPVSTAS
jgi:hypothetical protein